MKTIDVYRITNELDNDPKRLLGRNMRSILSVCARTGFGKPSVDRFGGTNA